VSAKNSFNSNFRFPNAAARKDTFEEWFAQHGYEVVGLQVTLFFEEKATRCFAATFFSVGYRFRVGYSFTPQAAHALELPGPLGRIGTRPLLHLDTCFCPLPKGPIWYPAAFDEYAQRAIRNMFRSGRVSPEKQRTLPVTQLSWPRTFVGEQPEARRGTA